MIKKVLKELRRRYYRLRASKKVKSIGKDVRINYKCKFTSNTVIGNNCHFNGMKISGRGAVTIGDNFHSGEDVLIIVQNHNYDNGKRLPYDDTYIIKDVTIGKNVWIGSRVIILPGTEIGDGVIVQAGSVVHGKIPPLSICGGNPAKVFKYRDKEHYDELESAGLYH